MCRVCDTPANKTSLRTFLSMRPVQKRFGIRYTQVTSATRIEPVCTIESLNLHQHDDTCYDSEGNLTCGKKNDSFTYYVGSLAPGESKTLTYTVNVEPGAFMAAGNKDFRINNRACIYTDDSRTDGGVWLKGYNTSMCIPLPPFSSCCRNRISAATPGITM